MHTNSTKKKCVLTLYQCLYLSMTKYQLKERKKIVNITVLFVALPN